jgi:hypothetical protein
LRGSCILRSGGNGRETPETNKIGPIRPKQIFDAERV